MDDYVTGERGYLPVVCFGRLEPNVPPTSDYLEAAMGGLAQARRAVAAAAGWEWCEVHGAPRWNGSNPCIRLHPRALDEQFYDEDGNPELPPGAGR